MHLLNSFLQSNCNFLGLVATFMSLREVLFLIYGLLQKTIGGSHQLMISSDVIDLIDMIY